MRRRRWSDLPPDPLREIAGRLHVAADFVRFHAVCKPWRSSRESTYARNKTTDQFLPWLFAPNEAYHESHELRCVFSKSSYLSPPPPRPISGTGMNWVTSADGTAVCYVSSSNSPDGPTLHDPLSGTALTQLPLLLDGQEVENPRGIIYNDGTVLLYKACHMGDAAMGEVRAALLRPGDDSWTVIQRTIECPNRREFFVAYHAGKILVTVEDSFWDAVPLTKTPATASDDVPVMMPSSMPEPFDNFYEYGHVLESRGELLWVLLYVGEDFPEEFRMRVQDIVGVGSVSVTVRVLESAPAPQWVQKEGNSLADRVLFLSWPNSFAVDATQLGVAGGFIYFMYDVHDDEVNEDGFIIHDERRAVFKHNLINKTTEFVDWLPTGWDRKVCTWFIPQPIIAAIRQGSATARR